MTGVEATVINRYVEMGLAEFVARRMRDISARINCHTVGTIQSFDATNQTAVVSVNFQKVIKGVNPLNNVAGSSDMVINYPALVNVPIMFMQGGSSYMTFPIAAGDTCILMFCDRDMDIWFATGQIAPPNSERVHDVNDAIAIVGVRNLQNSLADYNTEIIEVVDKTGERLSQAGFLQPYAGSTAPSGWLLCYGQSLLRADYAILFAVIGTTYGSADGTHFNIPDLRGRTVAGLDNMGGSDANILTSTYSPNRNTLGGALGEETHLLTGRESGIQLHNHNIIDLQGNGSGLTGIQGTNNGASPTSDGTAVQNKGHLDALDAHYNVQPSRMVNWLIKI